MYLKKLTVQGFKSFSEKTEFTFDDGVTAIVGPNGSGKSNVSDALRYVMGEGNVRTLRGSKMEDLIFAGTQVDKAVNFAEVTLTLDNADHTFPIDFPEVSVTRRVFKSGENEYYINKKACRLRDINELFMDTGLGRGGYSVIGQGRIEDILSTKPEERRSIFESAAGISKYKYRRDEAVRKLALIEDNLERVGDILGEIEGRLEPLYRQSETAKQYLACRDALRDAEVNLLLRLIDDSREKLSQAKARVEELSAQQEDIRRGIVEKEAAVEAVYASVAALEEKITDAAAQIADLVRQHTEADAAAEIEQGNIAHAESNLKKRKEEIAADQAGKEEAERRQAEAEHALAALLKDVSALEEERGALTQRLEQLKGEAAEHTQKQEAAKAEILELVHKISDAKADAGSTALLRADFTERQSQLMETVKEKQAALEEKEAEIAACRRQMEQVSQELSRGEGALSQMEQAAEVARHAEAQLRVRAAQEGNLAQNARAQHKLLSDMREAGEGYPKAVQSVLKEKKAGRLSGIEDTVGAGITVAEEYVTAVEVALGAAVNNIITDTEESAKAAIEFLKRTHAGRVTFLPRSSVRGSRMDQLERAKQEPGAVAVASELVKTCEIYRPIMENLLGRTLVADNMDSAVALSRKYGYRFKIVTLDGGVCNVGGSLTGGSLNSKGGVLSGGVHLEKLAAEIRRALAASEAFGREADGKKAEISVLEGKIAEEKTRLEQIRLNLGTESNALSGGVLQSDYLRDTINSCNRELSALRQNLEEIESRAASADALAEKLSARKAELEGALSQSGEGADALLAEIGALSGRGNELAVRAAELKKDQEAAAAKRQEAVAAIRLQNERITAKEQDCVREEETCRIAAARMEGLKQKAVYLSEESAKWEGRKAEFLAKKETSSSGVETLKRELSALRETGDVLAEQKNALVEKTARAQSDFDSSAAKLWDEYELSYSDASALRREIRVEEARKIAREMREKIRSLGNVNVGAIEEYKETKERFEFLHAQAEDLVSSKADLHTLIADMQKIMTEQFTESFRKINENFGIVFCELFGGGSASLTLEDTSDVLESNIVIHVQPPGKKLTNLNLMSGGEKALSAIALLFAILRMKPTPFCILDEIDAPLDEVNVDSFASYLKKYSAHTQFILITHRQGTMDRADTLYGVTMPRRGVSVVLKLDTARYAE